MTAIAERDHRNELVDFIRGISILLVLILHFHLAYRIDHAFLIDLLPNRLLHLLLTNGNYGVVMFFVISGYLITSTTLARFGELKNVSLSRFYSFRFARIAPNIALMLALVVGLGGMGLRIFQNDSGGPSLWLTVGSVLTFTHNLLMEKYGYFNYCLNILWSLSVEEVFYLTFPLLCLALRKKSLILAAWVAFVVIAPIYRFQHQADSTDIYGLYDYLACFDGIAIGCIVAILKQTYPVPAWLARGRYLFWSTLAFIFFYKCIWSNVVVGISGVALSTGLILLTEQRRLEAGWARRIREPFCRLGRYSYELYLFHIVILALMKTALPKVSIGYYGKSVWFLLFLVLSTAVSVIISRFYSEPLNRAIRGKKLLGPIFAT